MIRKKPARNLAKKHKQSQEKNKQLSPPNEASQLSQKCYESSFMPYYSPPGISSEIRHMTLKHYDGGRFSERGY